MGLQYIRKVGLLVQASGGTTLDLSDMQIRFRVEAPDEASPPTAVIRVYNLKDETARQIQNEFQGVSLQAGYQSGNYGVIFQGSIIRARRGRESSIDSFIDLMAGDLQGWFDFGVVNTTLAAGSNLKNQLDAVTSAANTAVGQSFQNAPDNAFKAKQGYIDPAINTGGTLPRGKVLFGLARDRVSDIAATAQMSWSIKDGQVEMKKLTGYAPGDPVQINSATGMILVPEATIGGIEVLTLLNPNIKPGQRIQLNNKDLTTTSVNPVSINGQNVPVGFPSITGYEFFASLSADGYYRAIVVEHEGDSRGEPWYTRIVALSLDNSAAASGSLPAYPTKGLK